MQCRPFLKSALVALQIENSKKHKEKVAKNRELFEKVFPELRKQREERERFSRVGARVKSDAEMEEIMDGLQEQEVGQGGAEHANRVQQH